jgi:hypothetical protein
MTGSAAEFRAVVGVGQALSGYTELLLQSSEAA